MLSVIEKMCIKYNNEEVIRNLGKSSVSVVWEIYFKSK